MIQAITIDLDRPRKLTFTLYAQMKWEESRGRKFSELDYGCATDVAHLIWACLLQSDPDVTVEDVAKLVDMETQLKIGDDLLKLANVGPLGEAGSTSGPSGDTTSD